MKLVAQLWPPSAVRELNAWESEHRELIETLPAEAVQISLGRANPTGECAFVEVQEEYAALFRRQVETWEDWKERVLITRLTLAPALTVADDLRDAVELAFIDSGIRFHWDAARGDLSREDVERLPGGVRVALPSLLVTLVVDDGWRPGHVVALAQPQLATALGRIRAKQPLLSLGVKATTRGHACLFGFRPSASPEDIALGLSRVRDANWLSSPVGWDEERAIWSAL